MHHASCSQHLSQHFHGILRCTHHLHVQHCCLWVEQGTYFDTTPPTYLQAQPTYSNLGCKCSTFVNCMGLTRHHTTYLDAENVLQLGLQVRRRGCRGGLRRLGLDHVSRHPQGRATPERVQVDVSHHRNFAGGPLLSRRRGNSTKNRETDQAGGHTPRYHGGGLGGTIQHDTLFRSKTRTPEIWTSVWGKQNDHQFNS